MAIDPPVPNDGACVVLASATTGSQSMPRREQRALNSPESVDRSGMLWAADMNRKNIDEATQAFPNNDRSAVFATNGDPQLPQTPVARANVQDANEKTMPQAVAELNRSQTEREHRQVLSAQPPNRERDVSAPSHGALA